MMLVTAAHGSWTWIRPSAPNGKSVSEPLSFSEYVPCCQKMVAWMQDGLDAFEL